MKKITILIALFAALTTSCVVHTRPVAPALKVEVKPARPHAKAVWVPGHWKWNRWRHKYTWVPGHWKVKKGRRGKRVIIR